MDVQYTKDDLVFSRTNRNNELMSLINYLNENKKDKILHDEQETTQDAELCDTCTTGDCIQ